MNAETENHIKKQKLPWQLRLEIFNYSLRKRLSEWLFELIRPPTGSEYLINQWMHTKNAKLHVLAITNPEAYSRELAKLDKELVTNVTRRDTDVLAKTQANRGALVSTTTKSVIDPIEYELRLANDSRYAPEEYYYRRPCLTRFVDAQGRLVDADPMMPSLVITKKS